MYIVHIVKNLVKHVPRSVVSHNIWLLNEEKVMVKYCDYGVHSSAGTTGERLRFQYKQVRFLVGKKMFDFALTHLLCLNSTKFSIQAVLEYVRSLNSRVIVNGVDVVGGERIPVEQFEWFCSALYVEAYRRRRMGKRLLGEVLTDEVRQRSKSDVGFATRVLKKLLHLYRAIDPDEDDGLLASIKRFHRRVHVFLFSSCF